MKNFTSWLIVMFGGLFWLLRFVVLVMASFGREFPIKPVNEITETLLLFIAVICIVLIAKRKMVGGVIYMLTHLVYYGIDIFQNIMIAMNGSNTDAILTAVSSLAGVIIPVFAFLDLLFDQGRKKTAGDKKTDWFYKNEQFDRKLDERADKNQYRI